VPAEYTRTQPRAETTLADRVRVAKGERGTGAADGLMKSWFDRLIESDSPGCYLQTLVENTRAVRFFERMGFIKHGPTPLVPGIRHGGQRLHQQMMVWSR
jgi:predicted GNAT family N-acyltransferase